MRNPLTIRQIAATMLALLAGSELAYAVYEIAPAPLWLCGQGPNACTDAYGARALDGMESAYGTYNYEAETAGSPADRAWAQAGAAALLPRMRAVAARMDPAFVPYETDDILEGKWH